MTADSEGGTANSASSVESATGGTGLPVSTENRQPPSPARTSRTSSIDPLLAATIVLHVFLLGLWSIIMPLYDAPDEPQHVDMVIGAWERLAWPGPRERVYAPGWLEAMEELRWTVPETPPLERALDPVGVEDVRADPRSWNELAAVGIPSDTIRNQMAQHPPLYYRTARGVLSAVPRWGEVPYATIVAGLRALSVLAAAALPALVWATVMALGVGRWAAATAALVAVAVPTLTHINSVVTTDALLTTLAAAAVLGSVRVVTRRRPADLWLAAGATSAAALTKAFGLVLLPGLAVAVWTAWRRGWRPGRAGWIGAGLTLAPAAWWYAENLLRYGEVQPSGFPVVANPSFTPRVGEFARVVAEGLTVRFWASFGWFEVEGPLWAAVVLCLVGAGLVVAGTVSLLQRTGWPVVAVLWLPLLAIVVVVVAAAWIRYAESGVVAGIQGRYLFVALPGLAVLAGVAMAPLRRAAPLVLLAGAAVVQAIAISTVVDHFWAGEGLPGRVTAVAAWSPWGWPGLVLVLLGLVAGLAGVLTVTLAPRGDPCSSW